MPKEMSLFEAIYTTRAIRKFKSDPVPGHLLRRVLEAANQGPSGMNSQPWRFIVVREPNQKRKVAELYRDGFLQNRGPQTIEAVETNPSVYLAMHMDDAPVILAATANMGKHPGIGMLSPYASTFPGIQNLLLMARSVGLGGTITTNHMLRHEEIKAQLGIPEDRQIIALIPLGFPTEPHGPKTRRPVEEVTYADSWDEPITFRE